MKIVLLTRTSRPSGALIAKSLIEGKKNLVAIVAEERSQLLKKKDRKYSLLLDALKVHGPGFTTDRFLELLNIKLHFILRKILTSKLFRNKQYLSIEELILDHKIPYFVVKNHNSKMTEELIRRFSPDLIVLTNTRLIRKNILDIPKHGCLNLHLSLLPKYAGLDSIFWALFHGEKEIGVSVHFVTEELDKGDIVLQKKIKLSAIDNQKTLYRRAVDLGATMMREAVTQIEENKVVPIKQDERLASYFSWPTKEQRWLLRQRLKEQKRTKEGTIKILHIITRLVKGGAQENTVLTVSGLSDKGYDVTLVSGATYGPEGEIETKAKALGVNLVILPQLVRQMHPVCDLISFVQLYFFIKRNNFDIVHTHTSKAGVIGRMAARLAGTPVIIHTPHGHIFHSYFSPITTKFFLNLEKLCGLLCDKIITLTDRCKSDHIKLGIAGEHKFQTIHSGIELDRFLNVACEKDNLKEQLGLPKDLKIVGTVSRLVPIKGLSFLIEAMAKVTKEYSTVHFLIVGDGWQRKDLQKRAELLGLNKRVTFTGLRDDIPELLSVMDIFVLPSLNEGMGRVLIEAGIMSKPVVASRVSGIPELVEDGQTGILVSPGNSTELAAGITTLLLDPHKSEQMGQRGRMRMLSGFGADTMVDKIENLYREILGTKRHPGKIWYNN